MPKKIFIGSLSARATTASLEELFAPFGRVVSAELLSEAPEPTAGAEARVLGPLPGGAVTFADDAAGERAIRAMNGAVVDNASVTVIPWPTDE